MKCVEARRANESGDESQVTVLCASRYRVFGSRTFAGNPVALFEVDALDDTTGLQQAAKRSDTEDNVFFMASDGKPVMARFFSSTAELWLCGHGLLALSYHLRARGMTGTCAVNSPHDSWQIHADAQGPGVLMPVQHGVEVVDSTHWMTAALRSVGIAYERLYMCPNGVWLAMLHGMKCLLDIDAGAIAALPCSSDNTPGALIAALPLQDAAYGFRYFAPWHGKVEDSGTGSAHCYLAPLLASSTPRIALQFSPEGVAEMCVDLRGDRVAVSGRVEPYDGSVSKRR